MNIFEQASRNKIRFASTKGDLTTEQLWDLPLTSRNGFDLDAVAREANREVKALSEESFVAPVQSAAKTSADLKLEVVKHIIAVRLAEKEAATSAASRRAERERLMTILDQKKDAELQGLTREELEKRIADLG